MKSRGPSRVPTSGVVGSKPARPKTVFVQLPDCDVPCWLKPYNRPNPYPSTTYVCKYGLNTHPPPPAKKKKVGMAPDGRLVPIA